VYSGRSLPTFIALMLEAASTSETSVNFYQTTRRYNPEDSNLHTRRREHLKYYFVYKFFKYVDETVSNALLEIQREVRETVLDS
jgi:hypothetical protein